MSSSQQNAPHTEIYSLPISQLLTTLAVCNVATHQTIKLLLWVHTTTAQLPHRFHSITLVLSTMTKRKRQGHGDKFHTAVITPTWKQEPTGVFDVHNYNCFGRQKLFHRKNRMMLPVLLSYCSICWKSSANDEYKSKFWTSQMANSTTISSNGTTSEVFIRKRI